MDLVGITQDTLEKSREIIRKVQNDPRFKKAITVGTGLVGINLQAPAKQLVPLLSPFRASIPRLVKPGANSDTWRTISALSLPELFTTENASGNLFTTTLGSTTGNFKVASMRGQVTREAEAASQGFDPALAKETSNTLLNALRLESMAFMGANITDAGTPGAPTVALGTTAGSLNPSTTTYYARVVGLTLMAANRATLSIPADKNANDENLLAGRAVTQAELQAIALAATAVTGCGMTDIGAEGNSGAQTGSNKSLKITWTPLANCVAYLVFVGTSAGAANLNCEAIVTQSQITLTSLAGSGAAGNDAAVPAADETGNANQYDGIIPQLNASGSGAYVLNVNETLTGTAAQGEILELQDAFASIFQTAKIGKFRVIVSGQDSRILTRLGVVSNTMQIFAQPAADGRLAMAIGAHVGEIVNATTGDRCPVEVDPWLTPGTILILPTEIPYKDANLSDPFTWVGNYDWERWDYASTTTTGPIYPFETRCNGVLESQFPGGCGILYNIWKG